MTDASTGWSFETKQVHAGATPDPTTGARATPIYQTTSYVVPRHRSTPRRCSGSPSSGNIYTRIMNPTQDVLEQRVAALEGGVAALAFASGQAAETLAILNLAEAGDHFVSSPSALRRHVQPVPLHAAQAGHRGHLRRRPRRPRRSGAPPSGRTPSCSSPRRSATRARNVLDVEGVADVAHEAGVPLVVDNTVPTPYLLRPIEHGADIVVHSATKFLGGHGTSIGGVIVDGGNVRLRRARATASPASPSPTRATTA